MRGKYTELFVQYMQCVYMKVEQLVFTWNYNMNKNNM